MPNPRIYIPITTFYPMVGGAERQALIQARSLSQRGYTATIITFRHNKDWLPQDMIEGVPVIRVAGRLLEGRGSRPRILQRLLYLLAMVGMGWTLWRHRQRYDILHVYQLTLLALPTALVCWLTGKPLLIVAQNTGPANVVLSHNKVSLVAGSLDATAPWLQVNEQAQVSSDLEDLERLGKPIVWLIRSLLQRIHAVIIILSSRMKGYLAAHHFNLLETRLIPSGVDITRFHPLIRDMSIDRQEQAVVCVSRLSYQKGLDILLQAWRLVHEQVPQARLIIVGGGPLQTQLEQMAMALGVADSVEFAGVQANVVEQLHRGSVAVLSSHWEGMPNALLEAMACGLACIATRVSGSEDLIESGVNGLLVEPGDYAGLAEALLIVLRDPMLARKYGLAARATVEQHYSLEHVSDMYIELYQRLPGDRRSVPGNRALSEISHQSS